MVDVGFAVYIAFGVCYPLVLVEDDKRALDVHSNSPSYQKLRDIPELGSKTVIKPLLPRETSDIEATVASAMQSGLIIGNHTTPVEDIPLRDKGTERDPAGFVGNC